MPRFDTSVLAGPKLANWGDTLIRDVEIAMHRARVEMLTSGRPRLQDFLGRVTDVDRLPDVTLPGEYHPRLLWRVRGLWALREDDRAITMLDHGDAVLEPRIDYQADPWTQQPLKVLGVDLILVPAFKPRVGFLHSTRKPA